MFNKSKKAFALSLAFSQVFCVGCMASEKKSFNPLPEELPFEEELIYPTIENIKAPLPFEGVFSPTRVRLAKKILRDVPVSSMKFNAKLFANFLPEEKIKLLILSCNGNHIKDYLSDFVCNSNLGNYKVLFVYGKETKESFYEAICKLNYALSLDREFIFKFGEDAKCLLDVLRENDSFNKNGLVQVTEKNVSYLFNYVTKYCTCDNLLVIVPDNII